MPCISKTDNSRHHIRLNFRSSGDIRTIFEISRMHMQMFGSAWAFLESEFLSSVLWLSGFLNLRILPILLPIFTSPYFYLPRIIAPAFWLYGEKNSVFWQGTQYTPWENGMFRDISRLFSIALRISSCLFFANTFRTSSCLSSELRKKASSFRRQANKLHITFSSSHHRLSGASLSFFFPGFVISIIPMSIYWKYKFVIFLVFRRVIFALPQS